MQAPEKQTAATVFEHRAAAKPTAGQGGQNVTELRKFDMTESNVPPEAVECNLAQEGGR